MSTHRIKTLCVAAGLAISVTGVGPAANAAFHIWNVKEVFSNADGSVQFVEMFDSFGGEIAVSGFKLRSNSDGVIKEFTFPSDLVGETSSHTMLIASANFDSFAGSVTPDFTSGLAGG